MPWRYPIHTGRAQRENLEEASGVAMGYTVPTSFGEHRLLTSKWSLSHSRIRDTALPIYLIFINQIQPGVTHLETYDGMPKGKFEGQSSERYQLQNFISYRIRAFLFREKILGWFRSSRIIV